MQVVTAATCFGKNVSLHGSGGVKYSWTPSIYLSNPTSEDPTVQHPIQSVVYSLYVADANGCWSIKPSGVTINVTPPAAIFVGDDTLPFPSVNRWVLHVVDINWQRIY